MKDEKKQNRQIVGGLVLLVIILIIAVISRLFRLGDLTSSESVVSEEMTSEKPQIEYFDNKNEEEVVKEYYESLEFYLDGSDDDIRSITSSFPEKYRDESIKKEMIESLEYIKDNNIRFDTSNSTYVSADFDDNRIVFTDNHYITSDFEDIRLVIVNVSLSIYGTSTDAINAVDSTNNVLVANYKGSWFVIPDGHYYFK